MTPHMTPQPPQLHQAQQPRQPQQPQQQPQQPQQDSPDTALPESWSVLARIFTSGDPQRFTIAQCKTHVILVDALEKAWSFIHGSRTLCLARVDCHEAQQALLRNNDLLQALAASQSALQPASGPIAPLPVVRRDWRPS
ncbi:unnamed protein product [Parajaminaea phylloscopi]